ncbi:hypothetical protein L8Q94_22195, partial [Enterobacter kobei]|nr:hypothetical protein [Enterobacter kobei]
LLCHGMVCVVGRMRDLILQLSKSSIYSTKPFWGYGSNDTLNTAMPFRSGTVPVLGKGVDYDKARTEWFMRNAA